MPINLELSDKVTTKSGLPGGDLAKGTADFVYGVPEKIRVDPTVNGIQNDENTHHDDDDNDDSAEVATFTGTIRPYAMAPFINGNARPSTQQRKEQRRMQNVLDTLDQKVWNGFDQNQIESFATRLWRNLFDDQSFAPSLLSI